MIDVIDNILEHLDNYRHVIGIYLDLQKAFDTVNHEILLFKLYNYGVSGVAYDWFDKNSSGDEIANVLVNDDIAHT